MTDISGLNFGQNVHKSGPGSIVVAFNRRPELWVWLFSLCAWTFLLLEGSNRSANTSNLNLHVAICAPPGYVLSKPLTQFIHPEISRPLWKTLSFALEAWAVMVIAMMFPLLNKSVRHIAFSVKRQDRISVLLVFLSGYLVIWTVFGSLCVILMMILNSLPVIQSPIGKEVSASAGFLIAALVVWIPVRQIWMVRCSQTMPIRIKGWQMYMDALSYGLKAALACILLCWAPMTALIVAHHNLILMIIVSLIVFYERYFLRHTSKFSGYAWGILSMAILLLLLFPL